MSERIVVIGAGPAGLGAGHELQRQGCRDFLVLEAEEKPGGLSRSFESEGYTWDIGGHVIFSHYDDFDRMLTESLGPEGYDAIPRRSYVRIQGTWVPYPFQNNIRHLPAESLIECLLGLCDLRTVRGETPEPGNFKEWIPQVFGQGIARHFMEPYNFKVWGHPLEMMSMKWIAERVSVIDFERVLRNVVLGQDDTGWGPNNTFRFPRHGGTGAIFESLGKQLGSALRCNTRVTSVDSVKRVLTLSDGSTESYGHLISTMPLDRLTAMMGPEAEGQARRTSELLKSGTLVVGVGVDQPLDSETCWMYFPEPNCPFYRVTNFAHYSRNNVPGGDTNRYSSFMCETSYSPFKPEDPEDIVERTVDGLVATGLLDDPGRITTTWFFDAPYGYPIPSLERDAILAEVQPWLENQGILSRGRFGAWKYEVGNMDHSYQMGVEAARRLLEGTPEQVLAEDHQ